MYVYRILFIYVNLELGAPFFLSCLGGAVEKWCDSFQAHLGCQKCVCFKRMIIINPTDALGPIHCQCLALNQPVQCGLVQSRDKGQNENTLPQKYTFLSTSTHHITATLPTLYHENETNTNHTVSVHTSPHTFTPYALQ